MQSLECLIFFFTRKLMIANSLNIHFLFSDMLCCVWPLYSGMLSFRDCGMLRHKPLPHKKPVDVESYMYWMCIEWLCKCAYVYMYRCISFWKKNLLEFTHSKLRSSRYSDDLLLFVFVCRTVSPGFSVNYSKFIMRVKLGIKWTSRIFKKKNFFNTTWYFNRQSLWFR